MEKKIRGAIKLIQMASTAMNGEPIEVCYSGGKDSDVILKLTQEAGVPYRAIYKCTTIDPPGTIRHAIEVGAEIVKPKLTFFQLIAKKGFPSRMSRFCCEVLKEYKILDKQIVGIRRCESRKRAERYKEPTLCRLYKNGGGKVEQVFPILDWSNENILWYINDRKIKLHPLYYRENGTVDVARRLGCIGCPMASKKKRIKEFAQYPNIVKAYLKAEREFFDTHQDCKSIKNHNNNEYSAFCREVFCQSEGDWLQFKHTIFGDTDCKAFLEGYFNIKL